MIESLTEEQEKLLPVYKDKWIKIGLRTGDFDENKAINAINKVYECVGLKHPKKCIFTDSPLASAKAAFHLLPNTTKKKRNKEFNKAYLISNKLNNLSFCSQFFKQLRRRAYDHIYNQTVGKIYRQLHIRVDLPIHNEMHNKLLKSRHVQIANSITAYYLTNTPLQDLSWLAMYDFISKEIAKKEDTKTEALIEVAKTCCWFWVSEDVAIISAFPKMITLDEEGRLHNETQMAVEYPDGFGVYAWHGVRVNKDIIEHSEAITKEDILKENNQEIKRVMITRYGWDKFLSNMNATTINEDKFGKLISTNKLKEYLSGEDDIAMFVIVKDPSTDRQYTLRVPPNMTTAHDAVAWTFDVSPGLYYPTQET